MRILLVRLRLIGDVVFTTPLLRALRRRYQDAHITYVVESLAAPVLRGNPHIDELMVVPRRRGVARMRDDLAIARQLRRQPFDLAIDLHGGPRSAWLTWASGAPRRIGYRIKGRSWMYTDAVRRVDDLVPRHSVLNQFDLLEPLGIQAGEPGQGAVEMPADADAGRRVEDKLRAAGINPETPLVVMHVSAGNAFRRWPEDAFSDAVVALAVRDTRRRILLTTGPADAAAAQRIAANARARLSTPESVPVLEEWDLSELRALVSRAAVYIGGDSGPLHVAATTETPIVEILGPTIAERSRPWRDSRWFTAVVDAGPLPCRPCHQRHCVPGDFRCLTRIAPHQVVEAAERALAVERRSGGPEGAPLRTEGTRLAESRGVHA